MKIFKELSVFFVICYISCLLTKIALNKLTFNTDYLLDSLFIACGATLGWGIATYIQNKKKQK